MLWSSDIFLLLVARGLASNFGNDEFDNNLFPQLCNVNIALYQKKKSDAHGDTQNHDGFFFILYLCFKIFVAFLIFRSLFSLRMWLKARKAHLIASYNVEEFELWTTIILTIDHKAMDDVLKSLLTISLV